MSCKVSGLTGRKVGGEPVQIDRGSLPPYPDFQVLLLDFWADLL